MPTIRIISILIVIALNITGCFHIRSEEWTAAFWFSVIDSDGDKRVTIEEWTVYCMKYLMQDINPQETTHDQFTICDTSGDNLLTYTEALTSACGVVTEQAFTWADINHDHHLSGEEFVHALIKGEFDTYDVDSDGYVTREDFKETR